MILVRAILFRFLSDKHIHITVVILHSLAGEVVRGHPHAIWLPTHPHHPALAHRAEHLLLLILLEPRLSLSRILATKRQSPTLRHDLLECSLHSAARFAIRICPAAR